jgi:glyoxylase-like metal-dependent hydrolase (beta-lactamase superfamily II)
MTFSRRELLALAAASGGTLVARAASPLTAWAQAQAQAPPPPADAVAAMRAQMGAVPISTTPLVPGVVMLSGPGGNVVVQSGPDGKLAVDGFVQPAWPKLKAAIDAMGPGPIALLIDTHWHLDHTDNNANFHRAGAEVLAHDNTRKRLNESHDLMGMHFEPVPPSARPTETFRTSKTVQANGDSIELAYFAPAHTDTDIYIHFTKANVLHMGDVFFNGVYPFIDFSTGGNINGMIDGAALGLTLANDQTKIVPGHGPLGDKSALQRVHDMLTTVRDRVKAMKDGKKSLADVVAAKPTADLDATWGKGFVQPDMFVTSVYNTLR